MIEIFIKIVVKCEVKPDEDIYKGKIYIMLIFQSHGYCSEVSSD